VLAFRPRRTPTPPRARGSWPPPDSSPVGDLAKYERSDDGDDYRHRMRMNAASLVILALLVAAGVWIANALAELRRQQDCALQGRRNCMQIELPAAAPERR
jgi:hypothetical protein